MGNWRKGWALVVHALNVFKIYPAFLAPIFPVWIVYASGILYLRYGFSWKLHSTWADIGVVFLVIFIFSFLILLSFATVLEMIHQVETGEPSLLRAFSAVLSRDLMSVLPLALAWAIVWLVLSIIEAMLSKSDRNADRDNTLTAQHAAMTLANYKDFSFSAAFIDALQKGVRMVMFLILPTIAWERLGFFNGVKKGLAVFRAHLALFGTGYALTYAAAAVVFLPAAVVLELGTDHHGGAPLIDFPSYVWVATIIYMGCAWSLSLYLEQMFMAQLYLWHMKWEQAAAKATEAGEPAPAFDTVPRPELLTKTPGLFSGLAAPA